MELEPADSTAPAKRDGWSLGIGCAGHLVAAIVAVLLAIAFLVPLVEESRWAFTTVVPERICADGQTGSCLERFPARVVAANDTKFWVVYDDARRGRSIELEDGVVPRVGSRVILEQWKSRLVSVVDGHGRRRHTGQWPQRGHDFFEAIAALVGVLLSAGAIAGMTFWARRVPDSDGGESEAGSGALDSPPRRLEAEGLMTED
jgi:hypothetical protein